MENSIILKLLEEFNETLNLQFTCPPDLMIAAASAANAAGESALRPKNERSRELFALVNSRLKLNKERIKYFIDTAARMRIFFNYHEKNQISAFFNGRLYESFENWCQSKSINDEIKNAFQPIEEHETISGLHQLLSSGHVNRIDAKNRDITEKQVAIKRALFGGFVFRSFEESQMHMAFNADAKREYFSNFLDHLRTHHHHQLHRECALIYQDIDLGNYRSMSDEQLTDLILTGVQNSYERLANHCYFAIRLRWTDGGDARQWRLFSNIVLFAEKHREIRLSKAYFKPGAIQAATRTHLGNALNSEAACFDIANEGFFFKDCFILSGATEEDTTDQPYDILILFEKNERDERVVPCPACRSLSAGGNSYPSLGVKSWECQNLICPERSAYDRGNRYSLSSIIKQEAISSEQDQIPIETLKRWRNDVLFNVEDHEVTDMLIRHFSLHKDRIVVMQQNVMPTQNYLGREVTYERFGQWQHKEGISQRFFDSPFFKRFAIERPYAPVVSSFNQEQPSENVLLVNGDCESGLHCTTAESIDGAVTSPPYYNAREYSQWKNIYCYLYDMYNSARAVFSVLKPGSIYIYNIFDYFDNENILAFSSMGQKRMILGAYIIYLFEKAGFEVAGNVIWFKGDIEGKRNFNQGNTSPYYQLPFNCWEHCIVFYKPGAEARLPAVKILKQRPVIKMVRGKNTNGHSAPFPPEIPQLLIDTLQDGSTILDPYSGSMTSACTAVRNNIGAIMYELNDEYFDLGLRNVWAAVREPKDLFKQ